MVTGIFLQLARPELNQAYRTARSGNFI